MHHPPFPARIFLDFRNVSLYQGVEVNFKWGGRVGKLLKLTALSAPLVPGAHSQSQGQPPARLSVLRGGGFQQLLRSCRPGMCGDRRDPSHRRRLQGNCGPWQVMEPRADDKAGVTRPRLTTQGAPGCLESPDLERHPTRREDKPRLACPPTRKVLIKWP